MKYEIIECHNGWVLIERQGDLVFDQLVFKTKEGLIRCLMRKIGYDSVQQN